MLVQCKADSGCLFTLNKETLAIVANLVGANQSPTKTLMGLNAKNAAIPDNSRLLFNVILLT